MLIQKGINDQMLYIPISKVGLNYTTDILLHILRWPAFKILYSVCFGMEVISVVMD